MSISAGDKAPSVTFKTMGASGPENLTSEDLFGGKKVVLFAVPGAFTPTCSAKHLPGFVEKADEIKAKGVDAIACVAVNDVFVMDAWGKAQNAGDAVTLLADGSGDFAKAAGLEFDLSAKGLGVRNHRFSAIIDDGVVAALNVEEAGGFDVSSAEKLIDQL